MSIELDERLLPGILQDFVELIGLPATIKIVEHYGGVRLYVPKSVDSDHILVKQIGFVAFSRLVKVYGGEDHFDIPKAEVAIRAVRDVKIRASAASHRTLALQYDLTERHIRRIKIGASDDDAQQDLF